MKETRTFRFDPGPLDLRDVERMTAAMWSDLAFDQSALAAFRRDGLALDGVRLTGPCPYELAAAGDGYIDVTVSPAVADPQPAGLLIDLWQVHFMRGLRPGSIAA